MSDPRDALQSMFAPTNRYASFGEAIVAIQINGIRCHKNTTIELASPITAFSDKRANIAAASIDETVMQEIDKRFAKKEGVERALFPAKSIQISDRPILTFVVGALDQTMEERKATLATMEQMTRENGSFNRTFKSALIWVMADSAATLRECARKQLAWEAIDDEAIELKLDESQRRQLNENIERSKRDLRDSIWRAYKHVFLLGKDNALREIDLGMVGASLADTPITNIINRLTADGEMEKGISVRLLAKNWPAAFVEWPVKAARDALYASPQFPRIIKGTEAIQDAIAKGVLNGELAYVGKGMDGKYVPFKFKESIFAGDVEVVEEMFLITRDTADAYEQKLKAPATAPGTTASPTPTAAPPTPAAPATVQPGLPIETGKSPAAGSGLTWSGEIPPQKWMNFYTKVLSKFAAARTLKLTLKVQVTPDGGVSPQKLEETKSALRELGLNDDATVD